MKLGTGQYKRYVKQSRSRSDTTLHVWVRKEVGDCIIYIV